MKTKMASERINSEEDYAELQINKPLWVPVYKLWTLE